jgi:2-phosphosulfolactate phosphatase
MKKIDVIATAREANSGNVGVDTAVIIDVLRATSVMVTALSNGARQIVPVLTPEEALEHKRHNPDVLLGGERFAELIEGFDLGNSPLAYTPEVVNGKTIVMTTTNGTRAIINSSSAKNRYIACFRNAHEVARRLMAHENIVIVCSGADDLFTLEDALCAGYIISLMKQMEPGILLSDFAIAIYSLYMSAESDLNGTASKGRHFKVLENKGYFADLDYCFQKDVNSAVPKCVDGVVVLM